MTLYLVNASAIYEVVVEVSADNPEDAISQAKASAGTLTVEVFDRFHPDTEYQAVAQ